MSQYFNTLEITRGFWGALTGSLFIYLSYWGIDQPLIHTLLGLAFFYILLPAATPIWFWTGFFVGLFWFWWIGLSFLHYQMPWAIPFVVLSIGLVYGILFWSIAKTSEVLTNKLLQNRSTAEQCIPKLFTLHPSLFTLILKSLGLLSMSFIHPLSFDWYKPEILFVESFLGIDKWHFALILAAITLALWRRQLLFLLLVLLAYAPLPTKHPKIDPTVTIVSTDTTIEEKWNPSLQPQQYQRLFEEIDEAVSAGKDLVILPESAFPLFLNRDPVLFDMLKQRASKINIVTGALYWDGKTPRNSTYIFTRDGKVTVANKVVLVPFGERNPLPDFLGKWVNRIFYDDAVDYKADTQLTDYTIEGTRYRNAICFEATSDKLYEGKPANMIVLSNNGWFTPSIEPTLQRLLLQYYSRRYGTTIYHAVNMSPSYMIQKGMTTFSSQDR